MMHAMRMKSIRWVMAFGSSVFASIVGAHYYNQFRYELAEIFGFNFFLNPDSSVYVFFLMTPLLMSVLFLKRETLKRNLYIFPQLGRLVYKADTKSVFLDSTFSDRSLCEQLEQDVLDGVKNADSIELLLISGAEKDKDPFEKFVLKQTRKLIPNKKVTVYLLNPQSKYVFKRGEDRQEKSYAKKHREAVESTRTYLGIPPENIVYYDEYPIWRIFRFGGLLYVSRYAEGKPARKSITCGYLRGTTSSRSLANNPYMSFCMYLKQLQIKFYEHSHLRPQQSYVREMVQKDFMSGTPRACNCPFCIIDIDRLLDKRLRDLEMSFGDISEDNRLEIYKEVSDRVFTNKRHYTSWQI